MLPNRNRHEIEDRLIRISKILNDTYKNKSSEEYKMSGDITKSSYYSNIEKCIADLSTLRGFSKSDASDLNQMFNTLHRPFFKNMVKEYMSEPNEKNTVFCALFTLGFRLLIGELSRIYTSVEATSRGLEYKPDKVSRRNDVSKIISIYKGDLETKINAEIRATSKASTKIEESYLEDVIAQMYIEEYLDDEFGETIYDESAKVAKEDMRNLLDSLVKPIQEARFGHFRDVHGDEPSMKRWPSSTRSNTGSKNGEWTPPDDIMTPGEEKYNWTPPDDIDVKPIHEARFGRFREIRGDSPDMETRGSRNSNSLASSPIFQDPRFKRQSDTELPEIDYDKSLVKNDRFVRPRDDDELRIVRGGESEISTATDPSYGTTDTDVSDTAADASSVDTTAECGASCCTQTKSVQEGVVDDMEKMSGRISDIADTIGPKISNIAAWATPIAAGLSIFAGLFKRVTGFLSGKNPIAELNFYFTNKYEKIISKFNVVSANYFATKEAYDEYMKIPEAQRKKKVESKYLQNLEKYNIRMKNLNAQIEHFNSRASADAKTPVPKPTSKPAPTQPTSNDSGDNKPKNDDDFDF